MFNVSIPYLVYRKLISYICAVHKDITISCFRLFFIYQHDSNIQSGSVVYSELEILYLRVAARLFVNIMFFVIYFVYTRKMSSFDRLGNGYWQAICVVSK